MTDNEVSDPMEVLVRSKEIPDLPFEGTLNYKGIQTVATVFGIYKQYGIDDISENQIPKRNFSIPAEHSTKTVLKREIYDEEVAETRDDLVSLWTKIQDKDDNYILYKVNDKETLSKNKYVAALDFRFVYELDPADCSTTFTCRDMNPYNQLPESTPDNTLDGRFSDLSNGRYCEDKNLLKFQKSSLFSRLFGKTLDINLELANINSTYELYELQGERHIQGSEEPEISEYCSATISVSNGDYIIKCDSSEGPVTFRIPLTKFGTLPSWAEERVNIDLLVNHLEGNESVIVEIRQSEKSVDSNWLSELGDKELVKIK